MTYKETLFFVAQCLTINHEEKNRVAIEAQLVAGAVDWEAVVKLSTAHYVFPALYVNLERAGFLPYLPEDLVAYMAHITDLNRERNAQIIAQANEINALLLAQGIRPIFLKGTGNLLEGLYADLGERMVGDIDFLIIKEDFLRATQILKEQGYASKDVLYRNFHWHYPKMIHTDRIASVEVHQKILKNTTQGRLGIDLLNDVVYLENNIHVLSQKNKLLATILPKIINDDLYHSKKITLRNAYDVYLLSQEISTTVDYVSHKKMNQKLNNYLGVMKLLLGDTARIYTDENIYSRQYQKSFLRLQSNHAFEKKKVQIFDYLIKYKNRLEILQLSFTDETYRKYVLKRIFQLDFYKMLLGISKV